MDLRGMCRHSVAVVVDADPQLVTWFVDGLLCDGGGTAPTGWAWTAVVYKANCIKPIKHAIKSRKRF